MHYTLIYFPVIITLVITLVINTLVLDSGRGSTYKMGRWSMYLVLTWGDQECSR